VDPSTRLRVVRRSGGVSSSIQPACAVGRRRDANNNDEVMAATAVSMIVVVVVPLPSIRVGCFIIALQR